MATHAHTHARTRALTEREREMRDKNFTHHPYSSWCRLMSFMLDHTVKSMHHQELSHAICQNTFYNQNEKIKNKNYCVLRAHQRRIRRQVSVPDRKDLKCSTPTETVTRCATDCLLLTASLSVQQEVGDRT